MLFLAIWSYTVQIRACGTQGCKAVGTRGKGVMCINKAACAHKFRQEGDEVMC